MRGSGPAAGRLIRMALRPRQSQQMRHVPPGFRANATEAGGVARGRVPDPPAVAQVHALRARPRQLPGFSPCDSDSRVTGRDRGVARLDDSDGLRAAVRRQARRRRRTAEHACVLGFERRDKRNGRKAMVVKK
jgi:hypothetical protein